MKCGFLRLSQESLIVSINYYMVILGKHQNSFLVCLVINFFFNNLKSLLFNKVIKNYFFLMFNCDFFKVHIFQEYKIYISTLMMNR